MERPIKMYKESDTTKFFDKLSLLWYLTFLPNFWKPPSQLNLSPLFMKIYDVYTKCIYVIMFALIFMSIGAFWTQKELTQQQKCLRNLGGCASPNALFYGLVCLYYRTDINELLHNLAVVLKEVYNDEETEKAMIFRIKLLTGSYFSMSFTNSVWMGIYGVYEMFYHGGGFVTFISVWPDVNDRSTIALAARVVLYLVWFIVLWQTVGTTGTIITILISLTHQFKNLKCYFYSIDDTFSDSTLSQTEKENKFEKEFINGIRWHALTLRCVEMCQRTCRMMFNVQLVITPTLLMSIMPDILLNESDWNKAISHMPILVILLLFLGFYMWNAGDITVEASELPDAMYASGWHNCYGSSSLRVRKLVVIAMTQALQPVEMKAFGFLVLSYESYVTIVKTTYSVFTVFF